MKKELITFFLLLALLAAQTLQGQQWYLFDGYVLSEEEQNPVVNHLVFLQSSDSIMNKMTMTDENGYYFDSLFIMNAEEVSVTVSTFDCEQEKQSFTYWELETLNSHDFEICHDDTPECLAFYFYEVDPQNQLLLHFEDLSEGDIDKWTWDFGDGTTSTEENPSHLYSTSGTYEVCLTVENTEEECESEFCSEVVVGLSDCEADFEWEVTDENPLRVEFTDLSSGDLVFWQWDFGDSTYAFEQSPVHQYAAPGAYMVVLLVSDSSGFCFDQRMKMVEVYWDSVSCEAAFSYVLDTLNNTPNVYLFEDASEGTGLNRLWEFGDGQVSTEQNPQHIYQESGTYEVCLTVSSSPIDGNCFDKTCETIETPGYYNFGGQVFIDGFTINIDSNDMENVATAYLYRRFENQWRYMDQREFWKYGYYWFANKPEGEYLIRVDLMEGSLDYGDYLPAYYEKAITWDYAQSFHLFNDEEFSVNIDLKKLIPLQTGIGVLSGYILPGEGCDDGQTLQHQLVQLFDANNQPTGFTYTDEAGEFSFDGLAFGSYGIKAELTGKSSALFNAYLDAATPILTEIELTASCNSFVGMDEYPSSGNLTLRAVYPVPADDFIKLEIYSRENTPSTLTVYNLNGQVVFGKQLHLNAGNREVVVPVKQLKPGLYLMKLWTDDGKSIVSRKILIQR